MAGGQPTYEPLARKSLPGTWTDERIVAALRDWHATFGETPLSSEWSPRSLVWAHRYPRWPSRATVCRRFGSWAGAVRAAGLPPARPIAARRGLAARVEAARRLSATGARTAEIAALLEVSPRTVRAYLRAGSCRYCGAPAVTTDRCPRCAARLANQPRWEREQVLHELAAWAAEEGSPPTTADWTPTADAARRWAREFPRWPSYVSVVTLFGSWTAGLEAAGLTPHRRNWDRDKVVAALREFADRHGRAPASGDLERDPELPSPATVRAHLGSRRRATP